MSDFSSSIAFLGPLGTYTHEAALFFAEKLGIADPELVPCTSFDEVFDCVDRGRTAYGVVGKENSLEGPVTATLDNFAFRSGAVILGEKVVDIHHCLVLAPGAKRTDIRTVASHPQGLAQCRRYLNENFPGVATIAVSSTAESARMAAADPSVAGIANALAAELHGATVARTDIEDHLGNQTSFALIGRPGSAPQLTGPRTKTSLALFLQVDRAGSLNMILSEFSMIQSRPTKQQLGDYMFFIEFFGSVNDPAVTTCLNCLRMKLREVKVLGCYPVE